MVLIFSTSIAKADDLGCKKASLYCKIIKFKPSIDKILARKLASKISIKAKAAGIDPNVALAVLQHESGLRHVNTYKTTTQSTESCTKTMCSKVSTEVSNVFDVSIAQLNINTINHYNFDLKRLYKGDVDYALDCFMFVLSDKINVCKKLNKTPYYSCYHSINDGYRFLYIEFVNKLL